MDTSFGKPDAVPIEIVRHYLTPRWGIRLRVFLWRYVESAGLRYWRAP